MTFILNILLPILIVCWAGYQIYRFAKRSKQGKCGACDCGCEAKRLAENAKKNQ